MACFGEDAEPLERALKVLNLEVRVVLRESSQFNGERLVESSIGINDKDFVEMGIEDYVVLQYYMANDFTYACLR